MTEPEFVEMTDQECERLLAGTDTGVLSLSTTGDSPPHSFPVSFGFDEVEAEFYFRLADGKHGQKGALADRPVTFVTYEQDDDAGEYRSVVAQGTLESTTDDDIATETLAGLERVTIPYVDIFGEPPSEIDFEFYRLVPDALTGRKETTTEL